MSLHRHTHTHTIEWGKELYIHSVKYIWFNGLFAYIWRQLDSCGLEITPSIFAARALRLKRERHKATIKLLKREWDGVMGTLIFN